MKKYIQEDMECSARDKKKVKSIDIFGYQILFPPIAHQQEHEIKHTYNCGGV